MNELEYLAKAKRTLSTKEDLLEHMIIGIGVGKKLKKDIKYLFLSIMLPMTLSVFGKWK